MTAFAIVYGADPTDRFSATAHPTREAARRASIGAPALPGQRAGGCGYVIESEEDVTFGGRLLVEVYNALTDSSVQKFESRAVGVKRLLAALNALAAEPATSNEEEMKDQNEATVELELDETETPTTEEAAPPTASQAKTAGRARSRRFTGDEEVEVLVEANPKREGKSCRGRFDQLMAFAPRGTRVKVRDLLEKTDVTSGDLLWDEKHEYVAIYR